MLSRAHEINFFSLHVPVNYIFYEGAGPVEVPAAAHSILNFEARVIERNHRKLEIVVLCGQRFERYNV